MKFKFAYENLLKNKKVGRDVAYRIFSDARNELDSAELKLRNFHEDIAMSRKLNQKVAESNVIEGDALEILKWTQEFLNGQNIKIQRQSELIAKKHEVAEEKREALTEAAKDFKIFEKLKEKMKEKFKKLQKKHDLKEIDEIVVMRAARRIQEG